MALHPNMDQNYVTYHPCTRSNRRDLAMGREFGYGGKKELRVGKDGWRYEPKGKGHQAESWNKQEVKEMVQVGGVH